ncbi:MAG: DUF4097 family beta strand repeat-containing protein [candidate division WOR-3 bacterium]|jgi:DUF4097 and DUF4098 domain-containing protein YvlB
MINAFAVVLVIGQLCNPSLSSMLGNSIVSFFEKTEEFSEKYEVSPGTELVVTNRNGDVRIEKWDAEYVEVHTIKKTNHDRDELAKVKIEVLIGDRMEIRSEYLDKKARVSVDYRISIPSRVVVEEIQTANGDIKLRSTRGDTRAVTANGDIDVKDVIGTVYVQTANGDIKVRTTSAITKATTANGDIQADIRALPDDGTAISTSNGSIDLLVSKVLNADLHCSTSMGEVEINGLDVKTRVATKAATFSQVKGRMGAGGPKIDAHTSNGDINIHGIDH